MITQQRQEEIDSATKTKPVDLTSVEVAELRMRNKHHFQMEVGSGKFRLPAAPDSNVAKAFALHDKGLNKAAIGHQLGVSEGTVTRWLTVMYLEAA